MLATSAERPREDKRKNDPMIYIHPVISRCEHLPVCKYCDREILGDCVRKIVLYGADPIAEYYHPECWVKKRQAEQSHPEEGRL